jgi:hypothetical protein
MMSLSVGRCPPHGQPIHPTTKPPAGAWPGAGVVAAGAARSGRRRLVGSGRRGRGVKLRGQLLGARLRCGRAGLRRVRPRLGLGGALLGGVAGAGERGERLGVPVGLGQQPVTLGDRGVACLRRGLGQLPGGLHVVGGVRAGLRDRRVGALLCRGHAPVSLSPSDAGLLVRAGLGRSCALGSLLGGLLGRFDCSSGGLVDLGDARVRGRGGLGDAGLGGLLGRRDLLVGLLLGSVRAGLGVGDAGVGSLLGGLDLLTCGLCGLLGPSVGVSGTRLGSRGSAGRLGLGGGGLLGELVGVVAVGFGQLGGLLRGQSSAPLGRQLSLGGGGALLGAGGLLGRTRLDRLQIRVGQERARPGHERAERSGERGELRGDLARVSAGQLGRVRTGRWG